MARKSMNTTIDEKLLRKLKLLSEAKECKINELIEEGIKLVLQEHKDELDEYVKELKNILSEM